MCWCDLTDQVDTICCSRCNDRFHLACEALLNLPAIDNFFCSNCENNYANLTTYKSAGPDLSRYGLQNSCYVVAEVLDHKISDRVIIYLIRWEGYPVEHATWEPEQHLLGCKEILEKYKAENNLIDKTLGAPTSHQHEMEVIDQCFHTLMKLQTFANKFSRRTEKERLLISCYNNDSFQTDEICILTFREHMFIILYFREMNIGFISDSENQYVLSRSIRYTLCKHLGFKLFGLQFSSHASIDNSISAATAIAITFWKDYHSHTLPTTVKASKTTLKQLKKL